MIINLKLGTNLSYLNVVFGNMQHLVHVLEKVVCTLSRWIVTSIEACGWKLYINIKGLHPIVICFELLKEIYPPVGIGLHSHLESVFDAYPLSMSSTIWLTHSICPSSWEWFVELMLKLVSSFLKTLGQRVAHVRCPEDHGVRDGIMKVLYVTHVMLEGSST